MPAPHNPFKAALKAGKPQMGCWLGLADPYVAQISAGAGFDWLLIDAEHAPNDLRSITAQMQVLAGYDSHAIVRPPIGEAWLIKQYLDAGAQTLLIPMVESADQARELVRAVTYPPHGMRGVGASLARSSNFGGIGDYLQTADAEICLLVQVENRAGMAALDEILQVDGVDGVFIGPADLAADMGYLGNAGAPEVKTAILEAMGKIVASGKAAGILSLDPEMQRSCLDLGATFVATNIDVTVFAKGMRNSAKSALALLPDQVATGGAKTESASRYLQQLCKHWSHKGAAEFDANQGSVRFDSGNRLEMTATDQALSIIATTGPRGDLARWKQVITDHLVRFAFREELEITWSE
jgi:4-hydroxy-2-oxoheptanedioate aldolase